MLNFPEQGFNTYNNREGHSSKVMIKNFCSSLVLWCVCIPFMATSIASLIIANGVQLTENCEKILAEIPDATTWLIVYGITGIIFTILILIFGTDTECRGEVMKKVGGYILFIYTVFWIIWMAIGVAITYGGLISCIGHADPIAIMMIIDTAYFIFAILVWILNWVSTCC